MKTALVTVSGGWRVKLTFEHPMPSGRFRATKHRGDPRTYTTRTVSDLRTAELFAHFLKTYRVELSREWNTENTHHFRGYIDAAYAHALHYREVERADESLYLAQGDYDAGDQDA